MGEVVEGRGLFFRSSTAFARVLADSTSEDMCSTELAI